MSDEPLDVTSLWPSTPADEHRTRDALDRLLIGFQIVGFDWRYLYLNPAATRHGRRKQPRELVGRTMMDAYPGIERTPLFRELQRCMAERCVATFENEFTFADGTVRWFELRVEPVPEGICIYSLDIQERKEAALALTRRLTQLESRRSLFDRLMSAVFQR